MGESSFGCEKDARSLYMISGVQDSLCFPQKETLGISALNPHLSRSRKLDLFELIEVTRGGNQRIVAAEKDAFRTDNFKGDFVD
jgi:hypothetical protein